MSTEDHHFHRKDRALQWRHIADHIRTYPEDLQVALDNLSRWETWGRTHPGPIREWRERILAARKSPDQLAAFVRFLAEPNHDSEPIKSCSPFVGLPMPHPMPVESYP